MIIRRWGSLWLTVALWISVGILLKRSNFELLGEAKAILTVLFGLATSFLLLSFIWLLQKKPLDGSWTGLHTDDSPSMHPRGRADSTGSIENNQRRPTVCTVASMLDRPPNYEDALIHSKPLNWTYLPVKKADNNFPSESTSSAVDQCHVCPCTRQSGGTMCQTTSGDCCICMDGHIPSKVNNKCTTNSSVTQLALTIVRGFTTLEPNALNQQVGHNYMENTQNLRKISYSQLDASQLIISESPPKYKELVLGGLIDESLSNNSNGPVVGERV